MNKNIKNNHPTVKFLFIRFSSIGDIILTTPLVRCLKNQMTNTEIHYLTKKQFSEILTTNPYIDKVHILEKDLSIIINKLQDEGFDYIIDLHKNIRSCRVKNKLKTLSFVFNKLNFKKWVLVNFKINKLPKTHIVDRYFETLKAFDIKNDGEGLDYFISNKVDISILPESFHDGYVAFAIGAKHNTKKLPNDKIISIINKIKHPVLLLGGKEDEENSEIIKQQTKANVYNACGKYSLNQSASLISQSKIVITHDTGLMHVSAAFNKKTISIWGNTIPAFGMYPYFQKNNEKNNKSYIIQVNNLNCRPCSKIGFNKCPKKHFKCMKNINEEEIITIINDNYYNKFMF
ncbi:MAG: glycosyltransferase family 9 protein [Bacteroidales bacterium]|nr:glycosyltransferase family 9 protein [Bacteroidales bacterium]